MTNELARLREANMQGEIEYLLMCAAENLRSADRTPERSEAAFRIASKLDAVRALLAASPLDKQSDGMSAKLGRFGHNADPAIDFCVEVEIIEGEACNIALGFQNETPSRQELKTRIARALEFRVGGDAGAIRAMQTLRAIVDKLFPYAPSEAEKLKEALRWYGEQARLARLIHSEGDKGRQALAADGGTMARAALGDAS